MKTLWLLYHDSCLDGFISGALAFAMLERTDKKLVVMPVNYNSPTIPAVEGDKIVMVDFSLPTPTLREYLDKGVSVEILDHHKTFLHDFTTTTSFEGTIKGYSEPRNLTPGEDYVCTPTDQQFPNSDSVKDTDDKSPTYAPVKSRPIFNIFVNRDKGSFVKIFVNDAEQEDETKRHSGASLVFKSKRLSGIYISPNRLHESANKVLGHQYEKIVELTRRHDLWLHKGDESDPAYALSHWSKEFFYQHSDLRKKMAEESEMSVAYFRTLIDAFNETTLEEKILQANEKLANLKIKIAELMSRSKEVELNTPSGMLPEACRVCYISDPDIHSVGLSIVGSAAVRQYGYDICVLDAGDKAEYDSHIYSLRSDDGKRFDVSAVCSYFAKSGIAITGGGHSAAAGVTFSKVKKDLLFK